MAEVVEIFMLAQNAGWFQGHDEGSKGEGLSRFLSGRFLAQNGFLGLGIDANYALADLWLNSAHQDYVNNAPENNGANEINGCTTLFIYYLFHQLGFSINQIVAAAAATLADVYRKLTGDHGDPFPRFKQLLDDRFPSHTSSAVPGPNFDDPWPLGAGSVAYTGVWRAGSDSYALWVNATQDSFVAKHNQLTAQHLRLVDFTVATVNGQRRWSGVWRAGTDSYTLWINSSWNAFVAKWNELSGQHLRLVSIRTYDGLWASAWRSRTDAHALWANANQSSFVAKWNQLSGQHLRLAARATVAAGANTASVELHGTSTGLGGEHVHPLVGASVTSSRLDRATRSRLMHRNWPKGVAFFRLPTKRVSRETAKGAAAFRPRAGRTS